MRIRLTGTRAECDRFTGELVAATAPGIIREVSEFHPNRGSQTLGRVYLDLALPADAMAAEQVTPRPTPARRASAARARHDRTGR